MYRALAAFSIALAAMVSLQQSPHPSSSAEPAPYEDSDAYQIYSLLIPHDWLVRAAHARTILIHAETVNYEMCLKPADEAESSAVGPAIKNFTEVNTREWLLKREFNLDLSYELLRQDEIDASFRSEPTRGTGWEGFNARHPQSFGWIDLSAVGFNADRTIAIVYSGHHCGNLCGGGGFAVFERRDGKWQPRTFKGTSCVWAS